MGTIVTLAHCQQLTLREIYAVANESAKVALSPATSRIIDQRRKETVGFVCAQNEPAYGFNRGFGHNVRLQVDGDEKLLGQLQTNLIRSHAMGLGDPTPKNIVRTTILLRANSLARGFSGVRSLVVESLLALLNADILPIVPRHGSVSASGDLAPMSHIALALLGEGEVFYKGKRCAAKQALVKENIAPLALEMKEGLALNNGAQYLTAIGIQTSDELMSLLRTATIATALSTQVMLGSSTPFREDLHALRPHPGALTIARWLRDLLKDSPIQEIHQDKELDGEIQDPYNIRCAAQILGTCYDLITEAQKTFEIEANSVTDNPLVLPNEKGVFNQILSGGHFHGMPVAVKIYNLVQATAIMARLSNMRCVRFVDEQRNKGLGPDLVWPETSQDKRSISSGMMACEYTSASLTNWIWGQTSPSHLFSISTDAGQEDHVSMGAPLAVRLLEMLPHLGEILAIELAFAHQASAIRKIQKHFPSKAQIPAGAQASQDQFVQGIRKIIQKEEGRPVDIQVEIRKLYPWEEKDRVLSPAGEAVLQQIQKVFPAVFEDRAMSTEIAGIARLVSEGTIVSTAKKFVPMD
ncbi:MAG: aromatic amino acid ammonia-lyase [Pseudomonadota bacterium]